MASYSPFFSSGFLAPYHAYNSATASSIDLSPIRPSSPMRLGGDEMDRSVTPTPSSARSSNELNVINEDLSPHDNIDMPGSRLTVPVTPSRRLRKRRSSLTVGTSQITAIKSPVRNANAAMRYAHHSISVCSPSRSRSGSIGMNEESDCFGSNTASQGTSLMGRLRSGSVGGILRARRTVRRGPSMPMPVAAPPTAPLPPLPVFSPHPRQPLAPHPQVPYHSQPAPLFPAMMKPARERAFSLETGQQIDNDMKEN